MKKEIVRLEAFTPSSSQKILFDTNILIHLFYPTNFEQVSDQYEKLYEKILTRKSQLLITSVQVSEFINRCIRIQYNLYKKNMSCDKLDFKKGYRATSEYREEMNAILDIIKTDILNNFVFIDDGFSNMQFEDIFIYGFSYDFNDALIAEVARQKDAILVTDDADFANYREKLSIVTSNGLLLKMH